MAVGLIRTFKGTLSETPETEPTLQGVPDTKTIDWLEMCPDQFAKFSAPPVKMISNTGLA